MSEEQAQQMMQQLQMLEQYAASLAQRGSEFDSMLREAKSTIESIRGAGEGADPEALMPVGAGVFLPASLRASEKVVVSIGAGVRIEKTRADALDFLEERAKVAQAALQDTMARHQDALGRLEQGRHDLNAMLQAEARKGNV